MAPVIIQDIKDQHVLFSIADAAYDSQSFYKLAGMCNIFPVNSINLCNGEQIKSSHGRVLSHFVTTTFGKQLMKECGEIEKQFSNFKDKGLKQPRWYGEKSLSTAYPASFSDL